MSEPSGVIVPKERLHFLDGLRGLAASMIVIHHAFTANIVKLLNHLNLHALGFYFAYFTQSGVELFFVLSGVVLLRPYLRKQKEFKVGNYFFRRIKRIYPPYFVALIFAYFVVWLIRAYPDWYSNVWQWADLSMKQLISQTVIINFDGYYYNLAWWSLGIELLFYILVPVCIFIFPGSNKVNTIMMWTILIITLIVSTFLQLWLTKYYPQLYNYKHLVPDIYQSVCYPVCFLLGMLLAARDFNNGTAISFIVPGVLLVLASIFYLPLVNPGYGFIYAGLIIYAFNIQPLKSFLSKPIMIWLGERSYSLFLIHFSIFYLINYLTAHFAPERDALYGIVTRAVGIPVALFAAMLLFNFVERKQARGLVTGEIFWPWDIGKLKVDNL
jgi:peptidoglycan/LPS O-acetylase OafA/YrhL